MKVLIAGATGLIGQELVRQCAEQGIAVNYLTTRKEKIVRQATFNGFYWNPSSGELDQEAFDGVNAIVNLAGATVANRWTKSYKKQIMDSRVMTARLIRESLSKSEHSVTHYVSSSGISYYPDSLDQEYQESFNSPADTFLGDVTVQWEKAALQMEEIGIAVSLVRTGLVLASDQGALPQMASPVRKGFGAALGSGKQWQSWIHLHDIAGIYLYLMQNQLTGVFNGVAPNPVSNEELTKQIATVLDKKIWLPAVPAFVLRLMLGEMAALVLEGQRVSCEKICQAGYQFKFKDVGLALEDLLT